MALVRVLLICFLGFLCGKLSASCPESFERHGNVCYKVLELNATWAEAKVYCSVIGGGLADIEDANENAIVLGIISRLHGAQNTHIFWLDGSDMMSENEWRWMGQNGASRPITFTNWAPSQPDNFSDIEHCLEVVNGHWNDEKCDAKRSFICEARDIPGNTEIVG